LALQNDSSQLVWQNAAATNKWGAYINGNDLRFYDYTVTGNTTTFQSGGNVGLGTTTPVGKLQVTGTSSTGGNALAIFNQTGSDDVFTASAGGNPRFTIQNNGNLITAMTTAGGIVYSDATGLLSSVAGSAGQCLTSNGSSAPSWASCSALSNNYWQLSSSVLSPINSSYDLVVGGDSTASAKFIVNAATGRVGIGGALSTLNARLHVNGGANEIQEIVRGYSTQTANLQEWQDSAGTIMARVSAAGEMRSSGNLRINGVSTNKGILASDGTGDTLGTGIFSLTRDQTVKNNALSITGLGGIGFVPNTGITSNAYAMFITTTGNVGIGTTSPVAPLQITKNNQSSALAIFNQLGGGDIFAASASGTPRFTIQNSGNLVATGTLTGLTGLTSSGTITFSGLNTNGGIVWTDSSGSLGTSVVGSLGQCLVSNGAAAPSWTSCSSASSNYWQLSSSVLSPINSSYDLVVGGNSTASAKFIVNAATGAVGIGTTTPASLLSVGSTSQFQVNSTGAIAAATGITSSGSITFSGLNTAGGVGWTDGAGTLGTTVTGAGGQCLLSNGTSAPSWGSCASGTTSYWQLVTTVLSPTNSTLDLAIGGAGTSSAKFFVSGTSGTASTSGQLTLNGTGTNYINSLGGQALSFRTSGGGDAALEDQLTILHSGNVGIGTNAPSSNLQVVQNSAVANGLWLTGKGYSSNSPTDNANGVAMVLGYNGSGNRQTWIGATDALGSATLGMFRFMTGTTGYAGLDAVSGNGSNRLLTIMGSETSNVGVGYTSASVDTAQYTGKLNAFTYNTNIANLNLRHFGTAAGNYLETRDLNNNVLTVIANNGLVGIGTSAPAADLHIYNTYGGGAAAIFDNRNAGDLLAASASGTPRFSIRNNGSIVTSMTTAGGVIYSDSTGLLASVAGSAGQCLTSNGASAPSWGSCAAGAVNYWQYASNVLSPINDSYDLAVGGSATSSAKFQVFAATGNATSSGSLTLAGTAAANVIAARSNAGLTLGDAQTGNIIFGQNGNVGIGNTIPTSLLSVGATSQFQVNSAGAIAAATGLTSSGTITLSGLNTAGGVVYTDGSGVLGTVAGSTGQCLTSNGSSAPSWASCSALSNNYWQLSSSVLSPINSSYDLVIGGNSTASAKFIVNAATGYLGVGTTAPSSQVDVVANSAVANRGVSVSQYTTDAAAALINFTKARGSSSSPSTVSNGDYIGSFAFRPYVTSSGVITTAYFGSRVNGTVTSTSAPTDLFFATSGGTTDSDPYGNNHVRLVIAAAGNVGVGTTAPAAKLDVTGNLNVSTYATVGASLAVGYATAPSGNGHAIFAGNVGVGTSSPAYKLDVTGTGRFTNTVYGNVNFYSPQFNYDGGVSFMNGTSGDLNVINAIAGNVKFATNNTERARFDAAGNFGIGTTAPTAPLTVSDNNQLTALAILNQQGSGDIFTASAAGTPRFTIQNNGNLITNMTTAGGIVWSDATGLLASSTAGSAGQCFTSNGSSAPSWASCSALSNNYWQLNSSVLSPINSSYNLAIGGDASTSANFDFWSTNLCQ
jgi:hypothetical protein